MAGVAGRHRPAAWLRHVANEKTWPVAVLTTIGAEFLEVFD